jgi:methionyl-tRNA formyltransferase
MWMRGDREPAGRRVLFWGSKELGRRCFAQLVDHARSQARVDIVAVCVSARDARRGATPPDAIAALAGELGVPVFTEHDDIPVAADVGLAVGYPHAIPAAVLGRCRDGALNLHMGPLPHYRGSKTLVHAILNGESRYGVSLHYMDAALDTGDVVAVRWMDLPGDRTAEQITDQLVELGFDLVEEHLPRLLGGGRLPAVPQSELAAVGGVLPRYYTRTSIAPLYRLSAEWDFDMLYRHVRALTTGEGRAPYLEHQGRRLYLSTQPPSPAAATPAKRRGSSAR